MKASTFRPVVLENSTTFIHMVVEAVLLLSTVFNKLGWFKSHSGSCSMLIVALCVDVSHKHVSEGLRGLRNVSV